LEHRGHVALVLGAKIFHGHGLPEALAQATAPSSGATASSYHQPAMVAVNSPPWLSSGRIGQAE
jgi:hypothetical protein